MHLKQAMQGFVYYRIGKYRQFYVYREQDTLSSFRHFYSLILILHLELQGGTGSNRGTVRYSTASSESSSVGSAVACLRNQQGSMVWFKTGISFLFSATPEQPTTWILHHKATVLVE